MIYFLYGDDTHSGNRAIAKIRAASAADPVNVARIDARQTSANDILNVVGTQSLFAERRLVILDGVGEATKGRKSKAKTSNELTIERLAQRTTESTTVVVVAIGVRSDAVIVKEAVQLAKSSRTIEVRFFAAPKPKEVAGWLVRQAKDDGIRLEPRGAEALARRMGDRFGLATAELEKLAVASGSDGTITAKLVDELTPNWADDSIFPLIDAIAARQLSQAIRLLERQTLQSHGAEVEVALPLIRLIARQYRILLMLHLKGERGLGRPEIISELKLSPYFADKYFVQAARLGVERIRSGIEALAQTEFAIKNGETTESYLTLLLAKLAE